MKTRGAPIRIRNRLRSGAESRERRRRYIYAIREIRNRESLYETLIWRCGVAHFKIPPRPTVVALMMRHPYKLFGFELNVSQWRQGNRPFVGDVHFPLVAKLRLTHVDTSPTNDILTHLGDLGLGAPGNVSPSLISVGCRCMFSRIFGLGRGGLY